MGKRTNTILQSAFFKLADVMPIEDAVNFMKQAAQKSYGKKGQDIVEMNWKAIDAGVDAIHKVDVPASWSNPEADPAPKALAGRPELVKQIRDVMEPIARMDGDSLPVSSFVANANGEWEQGASAYEKRGTAVNVPEWDAAKCVGCNQCAFVCSHATIRPFLLMLTSWQLLLPRPRAAITSCPRVQVCYGCFSAGLHGLRRVRHRLPHQGYHHGSSGQPGRSAGSL